jgi:16S rRNA (cytidine1402-2'-O)-methyltransferase
MSASPGSLYLVPNTLDLGSSPPIPEIGDVLPAGVLLLAARLPCWIAENAKTTRAFLKRVANVTPLAQAIQTISIVELPRPAKGVAARPGSADAELEPLLAPAAQGRDIGLISEAGLPAVADPGAAVVRCAHHLGIPVIALPGPSSLLLALAASGLNGQSFAFVGYLPVAADARAKRLRELEALSRRERQTQMVIETPYRNAALLEALVTHLQPLTRLSISCGLTLRGGYTRSDRIAEWRAKPTELPADIPAVFALLAD